MNISSYKSRAGVEGKSVRMVVVGDPRRFGAGKEAATFAIEDGTVHKGGRAEIDLYVGQLDDPMAARRCADALADGPIPEILRIGVGDRGATLYTSRGDLSIECVEYADGGKAPRIPADVWGRIIEAIAEVFRQP